LEPARCHLQLWCLFSWLIGSDLLLVLQKKMTVPDPSTQDSRILLGHGQLLEEWMEEGTAMGCCFADNISPSKFREIQEHLDHARAKLVISL
jgi:hypothetical protein